MTSRGSTATASWGTSGGTAWVSSARSCPTWACRLTTSATVGATRRARSTSTKAHVGPNGRVTRPGVDVFDPTGELIPEIARGADFRRVLQYQTRSDLNSDFDSLELAMDKRFSNRWSGRIAYTLARARDVGSVGNGAAGTKRFANDLNPREDYGPRKLRQSPRAGDRRERHNLGRAWRRRHLQALFGLSDQRNGGPGRQRRSRQSGASGRRHPRCGAADRVSTRQQRSSRSQRHRRREHHAAGLAPAVHSEPAGQARRQGSSSRCTTP